MKKFLEIGRLTKTQGLKGELRMQFYCDDPDMITEFDTLYLDNGKTPVKVEKSRYIKSDVVCVKLVGVESCEEAEKYIGKTLCFDRDDAELPEGTWFIQDIIGLSVSDADSGKLYGKIDDVYQNGSADVYSVRTPDGKQLLFPAIPEVLVETDFENGTMKIRPLEGLFDDGGDNIVEKED